MARLKVEPEPVVRPGRENRHQDSQWRAHSAADITAVGIDLQRSQTQVVQQLRFEKRQSMMLGRLTIPPMLLHEALCDPPEPAPDLVFRDAGGCANSAVCARTSLWHGIVWGFDAVDGSHPAVR
jgi:hypothetical protein